MPPARSLAVLLDLDGTLVDTVPFILASVRHAFAGRARAPTDAEWIAGIGTPLRVQLAAFADGPTDLEELTARYRSYQREHHDRLTRAFPGAADALRAVHAAGHRLGVVTGKLVEPARRALAHVGLGALVDAVVGADSCARHKPDPEPVRVALRALDRAPGDALFLGDAPVDVLAGNAAGVATAAATWGGCGRAELLAARPAHVLDRIEELPALVERLASAPPARAR